MTEEELDKLSDTANKFWNEFSDLCNRYIEAAPLHLRTIYEITLGERTSIYGRKDKQHE